MKKRNVVIIIVVFISIAAVFLVKGIFKNNKDVSKKNIWLISLKEQYEQISKVSKPSIIIFSYDADCCENTKKFFNEYNIKANQLIKDYEDKFSILFINTGTLSGEDKDKLIKIAEENEVNEVPAIVIRDSKGKMIKKIQGPFDDTDVRKLLDEVKM